MGSTKIKHFVIKNRIEELTSLAEEIEKLANEWDLSQKLAMNISLVVEEALSNIIFYAFTDGNNHEIHISISVTNNRLNIEFTDDGIPFNPLSHQKPDVELPLEERSVGGLGIFLMSQIMDEMNYTRKKEQNILTLTKSI